VKLYPSQAFQLQRFKNLQYLYVGNIAYDQPGHVSKINFLSAFKKLKSFTIYIENYMNEQLINSSFSLLPRNLRIIGKNLESFRFELNYMKDDDKCYKGLQKILSSVNPNIPNYELILTNPREQD